MTIELIFGVLLALFGLYALSHELWELVQARASIGWPAAEAVVIDARVRTRRGRRTSHAPEITDRYNYQGREYTGQRLAFGYLTSAREEAQQLAEQFAVGSRWEVRICEARPGRSVLHPGVTQRLWSGLAFWAAFAIAALVNLIEVLGKLK